MRRIFFDIPLRSPLHPSSACKPPGGFEGGFLWSMAPSLCPTSMLRVAAAVGTCVSSYVIEKRCNGENDRCQEMKSEGSDFVGS